MTQEFLRRPQEPLDDRLLLGAACAEEDAEVMLVVEHELPIAHLDVPVGFVDPGSAKPLDHPPADVITNEGRIGIQGKAGGVARHMDTEQLVQEGPVEHGQRRWGRQRTRERYRDLPSMTVGLMSVNLATSARTSAMPGLAKAAVMASDEANWK